MNPTARPDDVLPPPSRLDAAVRNLASAQRDRDLVGFVERWANYADPPPSARLEQARAFIRLCQPDKAWIRLRALAESPEASSEVLKTAAQLFLARGWPDKAREVLQRALPDASQDDDLQRLWDAASEPAADPPEAGATAGADAKTALKAAELHLSRGNTIIARGLLERLQLTQPSDPRVADLLWGLNGQIETEATTLRELTERYAPTRLSLGDMVDEHTDFITQEGRHPVLDTDEAAAGAFPSLFRGLEDSFEPQDEVTEEVTHAQKLATAGPADETTGEAFDDFDTAAGDTKVVRVRSRDGVPEAETLHVDTPEADPDFDLESYRREMGFLTPSLALEDEDDDLVVLIKRGGGSAATAQPESDPTMTQIGREVAHLLGGRPPKKPKAPISQADPSVLTAVPDEEISDDPAQDDAQDDADDDLALPHRSRALPWVTVGMVAVLFVGMLGITAIIAVIFALS